MDAPSRPSGGSYAPASTNFLLCQLYHHDIWHWLITTCTHACHSLPITRLYIPPSFVNFCQTRGLELHACTTTLPLAFEDHTIWNLNQMHNMVWQNVFCFDNGDLDLFEGGISSSL